ncbi:hypothetical protein [Hanstruepera ponticola]|uniref:hypothetical protein n=1 Tax=Hanstruepera ponticola TaxID=2042995 RepID=UPI00177CA540|nr:hypothetical protein [Hanstruepera ponticola]
MKKLLFIFLACSMMQVMGQEITPLSQSDSETITDNVAEAQMKLLSKRLNLNKAQQGVVVNMVTSQLRSEKFQKILATIGIEKLLDSSKSNEVNEQIQNALFLDPSFKKTIGYVLDANQKQSMEDYTPK